MKKIYPADEHTNIEYQAERSEATELEKAKWEIEHLREKERDARLEVAATRIELDAIKWTLETIFGRIGNG